MQVGSEHLAFDKLCGLLPNVRYSGQSTQIPNGFQPAELLPGQSRMLLIIIPRIVRFSLLPTIPQLYTVQLKRHRQQL